jgi:hypothetical protein
MRGSDLLGKDGWAHLELGNKGKKTRDSSLIPWKNYWAWRAGRVKVLFFEPFEDLGRRRRVRT